jgi:hypothetical protein
MRAPGLSRASTVSALKHAALASHAVDSATWLLVPVAAAATVLAFLLFDPQPNAMLALSAGICVGLLLWSTLRLYQCELLLTPFASVVVGPALLLSYSVGNLGARVAGDDRFAGNRDSLAYYPETAALAAFGLAIFCGFIFGPSWRLAKRIDVRYRDLTWKPWQAWAIAVGSVLPLAYLSTKYPFVGGYFRDVTGDMDRWLAASQYFLPSLSTIAGVSVIWHGRALTARAAGTVAVGVPLVITLGMRSRTAMLTMVMLGVACWITLSPRQTRMALGVLVGGSVGLFALGTVIKQASASVETRSIIDNLAIAASADAAGLRVMNEDSALIDFEYRLAGYELPAAILANLGGGAEPMYGAALANGALSGLPHFARPIGEFSERIALTEHFGHRSLLYGDSVGIPLTSGLADWGLWGAPVIYACLAGYCLAAWMVIRRSPALWLAYLMTASAPFDLLWENAFFSVRAVAFAWLLLLLFRPVLLPTHTARRLAPAAPDLFKSSRTPLANHS